MLKLDGSSSEEECEAVGWRNHQVDSKFSVGLQRNEIRCQTRVSTSPLIDVAVSKRVGTRSSGAEAVESSGKVPSAEEQCFLAANVEDGRSLGRNGVLQGIR